MKWKEDKDSRFLQSIPRGHMRQKTGYLSKTDTTITDARKIYLTDRSIERVPKGTLDDAGPVEPLPERLLLNNLAFKECKASFTNPTGHIQPQKTLPKINEMTIKKSEVIKREYGRDNVERQSWINPNGQEAEKVPMVRWQNVPLIKSSRRDSYPYTTLSTSNTIRRTRMTFRIALMILTLSSPFKAGSTRVYRPPQASR